MGDFYIDSELDCLIPALPTALAFSSLGPSHTSQAIFPRAQSTKYTSYTTPPGTKISEPEAKPIRSEIVQCTQLNVYPIILSPILRLPPEIIGEIFLRCLPRFHSRTSSRFKAPIILGQVCSSWREIALGLSALWEGWALKIDDYRDPGNPRDRKLLQKYITASREWFSRAHPDALLDYSCKIHLPYLASFDARDIISQLLLPHVHRCRRLDLYVTSVTDVAEFLSLSSDHIPTLECAVIQFDLHEININVNVFSCAPRLRQVALKIFASTITHGPVISHMTTFPWRQLTRLTIASIPVLMWSYILRECHMLREGIFTLEGLRENSNTLDSLPPPFPIMALQDLVCLAINYYDPLHCASPVRFDKWLDNLEFPLLANLSLSAEISKQHDIIPVSYLPSLRSLSISNDVLSTQRLLLLLQNSPGVTELGLKCSDYSVINLLAYQVEGEVYLPKLEKLIIHINGDSTFPVELFIRLVKQRSSSIHPIATLSLFVAKKKSPHSRAIKEIFKAECKELTVNIITVGDDHWKRIDMEEWCLRYIG